jgi:hypothetical protein
VRAGGANSKRDHGYGNRSSVMLHRACYGRAAALACQVGVPAPPLGVTSLLSGGPDRRNVRSSAARAEHREIRERTTEGCSDPRDHEQRFQPVADVEALAGGERADANTGDGLL